MQTGGGVILNVDDREIARYTKTRALKQAGYEVTEAATGGEALRLVAEIRPQVVILDVRLPDMSGLDVCRTIKRDFPGIMVLQTSASFVESSARVQGLDSGADAYLVQPVESHELVAMTAALLRIVRAEAEIRQRESRFRAIAESIPQILWTTAGPDGTGYYNHRWFQYTGSLAGGEAAWTSALHPEDREHAMRAWQHSLQTQQTYEIAFRLRRHDGAYRWHLARAVPVRSEGGELDSWICTATDIEEQVQAQHILAAAHKETSSLYRAYFENTAESLFIIEVTPDGRFLVDNINPAHERATGLRIEEIMGLAAHDYLPAPFADEVEANYRRCLAAGQPIHYEEQLAMPAGTRTWETVLVPVRDGEGRIFRLVGSARDQTARKEAEQALRQAQKMETVGQLTGGVAHDFNNLLTVVIGNLETLQRAASRAEGTLDPRILRAAENAARGARRAVALTQRLLAFSRRQPLDPKPIDANKLIQSIFDLLHRTLGEQVEIVTTFAAELWRTHADPNQLENAILNLALNARDAMPGGGKLTIETANRQLDEAYAGANPDATPGHYVAISVTDTGIGMTPEVIAQAFEPFFTTKDVGHGTGLGLSQVYGFVKQSGGHVRIHSEPGQGTTVWLYLPRLISAGEETGAAQAADPVPTGEPSETILVVEDDDDVRAYSTGILRELGYRVVEAASGHAALRSLESHPGIRLLFTDVGLPGGMNGRELGDVVRRRWPAVKVLYTTAYGGEAVLQEGRLAPGVELLTKPFGFADLATKVRELLDTAGEAPRILVVEDETLIRMVAVDFLLDAGYRVEEADSATEAMQKIKLLDDGFSAIMLDLGLPDRPGEELAAEIRGLKSELPIIVASGRDEREMRLRFAADRMIRVIGKPYESHQVYRALADLNVAAPAAARN